MKPQKSFRCFTLNFNPKTGAPVVTEGANLGGGKLHPALAAGENEPQCDEAGRTYVANLDRGVVCRALGTISDEEAIVAISTETAFHAQIGRDGKPTYVGGAIFAPFSGRLAAAGNFGN